LADTRAVSQTGWADTFAGSADHTAGAFSAASPAVVGIAGSIDTRAGTSGLSGGAIEYAKAVGA
jgi:hypothetical protein